MRLHVFASIAVACSAQVPVPVAGGAGIFQPLINLWGQRWVKIITGGGAAASAKFTHFVTSREADRTGKLVKISDQAVHTAEYVVWRYAIASVEAGVLLVGKQDTLTRPGPETTPPSAPRENPRAPRT